MVEASWYCPYLTARLGFNFSQVVLLNVYDVMIKAVMVVPRVETKLYSEWVSAETLVHNDRCPFPFSFQAGTGLQGSALMHAFLSK